MSQAGVRVTASSIGAVISLTGNIGGPVFPDGSGNINVIGTGSVSTSGSGNNLTISVGGEVAIQFNADSGSAVPSSGVITMMGGNNISTSASGSTVVYNVSGTTNHAVQVGSSTGSLTSLTVGTNGQVLVGATSANPSFITPTAGNGLSITTNSSTLSYAINAPVSIANGGTDATSFGTEDGVIYYDGTRLVSTDSGTSGYVLTSNGGSGSAPTFQALPSGSISITGDTGGALVGSSFTFTAGSTGLSFDGSGSTETLNGTLVVSNGGTGVNSPSPYLLFTGATSGTGTDPFSQISQPGNNGFLQDQGGSFSQATFVPATQYLYGDGQATVAAVGSQNSINIFGGTGISVTGDDSNTLTISSTGGVTLDGDTGSASGATITLAGSGTVSTAASGSTVTITGTQNLNADSGSATGSPITIAGASGISTSATGSTVTINGTNSVFFSAYVGTGVSNVTGNGTLYRIIFDNYEVGPFGGGYDVTTGIFTDPIGDYYNVSWNVCINVPGIQTSASVFIELSNGSGPIYLMPLGQFNPTSLKDLSSNNCSMGGSIILGMGPTLMASILVQVNGGAADVSIVGIGISGIDQSNVFSVFRIG